MTALRRGDIVTFKAIVIEVADYDNGQQIMAKILPNGETVGWCLRKENAFEPAELKLKVRDQVRHVSGSSQVGIYEVVALFEDKQIAIRKVGETAIQMSNSNRVRRI